MTTKEIQAKLIDHYSLAIERVKEAETYKSAMGVVHQMDVYCGVCACALHRFDVGIYSAYWVKRNKTGSYWGKLPIQATTKEEILSRLQLRLDILKKEYSLSIETIK